MGSNSQNNLERKGRTFKSVVVEPFQQIKFGLYVVALSMAFAFLTAGFFFWAFWQQYQHVMEIFEVVGSVDKFELVVNDVFISNAWKVAGILVLFIATTMYVVFRMTHKYYGPVVSIERFVGNIIDGKYNERVNIRNKDELQRLVIKLNKMAELLQKRHGALVDEDGNRIERRASDQRITGDAS